MRVACNGTELFVDTEGSGLEVRDGGVKERPTIVALHGGPGFDQGYLRPGLAPLSRIAQIVFIDLRGQGRSAKADPVECTLEQMADDVAAVCDALGIKRPIVFGHSAGGFVALHLALRHPNVADGLVLCSTSATLAPMTDDYPSPPTLADRAGPEAAAVAGRLFSGDMSSATLDAFNRTVLPFYSGPTHMDVPARIMALSHFNSDVATNFFGKLAPLYDLRPRLGEIAAHAMVTIGQYDWISSPAAGRALAAGIPGAKLVEFEHSGHFGFSEEPDRFFAVMSEFMKGMA